MQHRAISKLIGILVGTISLSFMPAASAQFTVNFQTNIISGVTSNWTGSYIVGSNTFLDALQIASGGVLSNGTGFIGYETSGSNNVASVAGAGSAWINRTNLYVGFNGAGNRLTITNGGSVFCAPTMFSPAYVGFNGSSSNNAVLVGGVGSVWSNGADLNVGYSGPGNTLTITNGAKVFTGNFGYIGNNSSSGSNKVLIVGTGSLWSNTSAIYVGNNGDGNSLTIADGGKGYTGNYGYVGNNSSGNSALVTGSNAIWGIFGSIYVGYFSSANSLTISNGGAVIGGPFNSTDAHIGYFGGNSNRVVVTGSGSVWSNINGITIGLQPTCSGNSVTVTNGGAVFNAGNAIIGNNGSANFGYVAGAGSVWSNGGVLIVGAFGPGNTLTITAGGKVTSNYGTIGASPLTGNNVIAIIGSGSVWSNSGDVIVGNGGTGNEFILFNGGSACNRNAYLGNAGSVTVASTFGGGSVWNNQGNLYVGYATDVNHLQVGASSTVIASNAYVGYSGGSFNLADVEGGNFYVTNAAHNAVLEVRCGQLNVSSGLLQVDILVCTNACAHISHTGGTLIYGSLILDPNMDADNDGLPNGWEQAHGLDPLSGGGSNVPSADPDGDGMSNLQEFLAGTDPTNSASAFRITGVVSTGSNVLVTWITGIGKTNALQVTAGTGNGSYATNNFADLFIVTNTVGTTTNFLDVGGATNRPARFYRVRLVP